MGERYLSSPLRRLLLDILVPVSSLPIVLPAIGAAALAVELIDGHGWHFSQTRVGKGGVPFTIHKIRTMPPDVDPLVASDWHRDERATKLGTFLRTTSVDEFPQIPLNVIPGKMSVIGPRPLVLPEYQFVMDALNPKEQREWQHARQVAAMGLVDLYTIRRRQPDHPIIHICAISVM